MSLYQAVHENLFCTALITDQTLCRVASMCGIPVSYQITRINALRSRADIYLFDSIYDPKFKLQWIDNEDHPVF